MNEQESTDINRVKLPRKVSEPFFLRLEDLEAIREIVQVSKRFDSKTVTNSDRHDGF